jgi:hypothetical protein
MGVNRKIGRSEGFWAGHPSALPSFLFNLSVVLLLGGSSGCASEMTRAAERRDRPVLGREILAAEQHGRLSLGAAAGLARVVVEREMRDATAPDVAIARVRDLRGCALEADDFLAQRMKTEDAAGGEAALERREAGAMSDWSARGHLESPDDRWRAVGMSGMTRDRDHEARLRGLVDGSPLVRRAALRAIVAHDDPADFDAVYAAARLDPEPLVRTSALRALPDLVGDRTDLANKLRDLWAMGDLGLREDITAAFAARQVFSQGGRDALFHVLSTEDGTAAIAAAGVVLHSAAGEDAELRGLAESRLEHAVSAGPPRERLHAIAIVPLGGHRQAPGAGDAIHDAVRAAAKDEDLDVRIAALGRLVNPSAGLSVKDRDDAVRQLENLAFPGEATSAARGSRARWLLAEAGDLRVQAWLEADLHGANKDTRLTAAEALAALGRGSRAAPLLADDDPSVRTQGACTILMAARREWLRREGTR